MDLKLTKIETLELVDTIEGFYSNIDTIQDYFLERKKEKIFGINSDDYVDYIFNDYDMNPEDMEIEFELIDNKLFTNIVQLIVSIPLETQIGRQIIFGLKEKKTNKYLAFIRITSPVLGIKPRNDLFGEKLKVNSINRYMMSGAVIMPVQPFGFNCLGGKLGALFCISHQCLNEIKKKYGHKSDICFFETTSLYGSLKENSQYDGLKPFIRNGGLTESKLFLFPNKDVYFKVRDKIRQFYGKSEWRNSIVDPKPSGPKMREFSKMISILKLHLKHYDLDRYEKFMIFTKEKMRSKTQKRYYYSCYGYENVFDYIKSDGQIELKKKVNYDNYDFNYLIKWWKRKSQRRYDKLKRENRLRKDIEIYTLDAIENKTIDMVR